jgi:hypothetical protein
MCTEYWEICSCGLKYPFTAKTVVEDTVPAPQADQRLLLGKTNAVEKDNRQMQRPKLQPKTFISDLW